MNKQIASVSIAIIGFFFLLQTSFAQTSTPTAPDEVILKKVIETGLKHTVLDNGSIKFVFELDNNRTQMITIREKLISVSSGDYLEILSRASITPKNSLNNNATVYELMRKNWDYQVGSWQVAEDKYGNSLIYLGAKVPSNISAMGLYRTLSGIAQIADTTEKELTQKDEN